MINVNQVQHCDALIHSSQSINRFLKKKKKQVDERNEGKIADWTTFVSSEWTKFWICELRLTGLLSKVVGLI